MRWRTSSGTAMAHAYRFVVPALGIWLVTWIVLSWAASQDDALIHLRYADNLYLHHFITYDGVNPNYGASSLLYVGLLAVLRGLTPSPGLPRAVSSAVHLLLFCGLALALGLSIPRHAKIARLAGLVLLALLVTPSAVRWLDDGMETGLAVAMATLMAWLVHEQQASSRLRRALPGVVAFFAVMLRTELLLLCGVVSLILLLEYWSGRDTTLSQSRKWMVHPADGRPPDQFAALIGSLVAIVLGAVCAVGVILWRMHVLLPDTAVAKAQGIAHWSSPIYNTGVTLAGAFSFGAGMLLFWLLTLGLVAMRLGLTVKTLLANCFCPAVLAMSSLRGQEIQGVRYFSWTFAFSIVWNILELAKEPLAARVGRLSERGGMLILYAFAALLVVELPIESVAMHRVLKRRSETMRLFASQHLGVLQDRRGVASDIGFIGYFSGARICDLAGLVNGRAAARLTSKERVNACAQTRPEFMFLNSSQFGAMAAVMKTDDWKVCGRYDFPNVRTFDTHYLLVRPEIAEEVCRATGSHAETVAAV